MHSPFRWGAKGLRAPGAEPRLFDCSGLVTWCLNEVGGPDWRATHNTDRLWDVCAPVASEAYPSGQRRAVRDCRRSGAQRTLPGMAKQVEKPEWARVAEAFEASGQTQREFALAHGVRLGTLQSWVYRARRAAPSRVEPVRLLPVQVAPPPVATESLLEVVAASGARVRFSVSIDMGYVARLVAALGR
ncbi:C40 family peptidase [Corallococcus interemptor]|uniref:IS66 family insertion sequence element accessory protein TnpA n=1 Tax=Corallococcus interemptor TaxID=2316720 RepID=UPI0035D3FA21